MLYNVRIFGKRYVNKTVDDAISIITNNAELIKTGCRGNLDSIIFELKNINETYRRIAFYGNDGKVAISINRVKTKRGRTK